MIVSKRQRIGGRRPCIRAVLVVAASCLLTTASLASAPVAPAALTIGRPYHAPDAMQGAQDTPTLQESLGTQVTPGGSGGDIRATWPVVVGASGYRIHAGPQAQLYTLVESVAGGSSTTGNIAVTPGTWYVTVSAYDENGYEGPPCVERSITK